MENNSVFRKKSMERISSPEQLNDYIRVSNPGVWLLLTAVVILLIGVCVWTLFGTVESSVKVCAVSSGSETLCYIREADREACTAGMPVEIGGVRYTLGEPSAVPQKVDEDFEEYALHIGNLIVGEWVYAAEVNAALPAGVYSAKIITEQIAPASFIFD